MVLQITLVDQESVWSGIIWGVLLILSGHNWTDWPLQVWPFSWSSLETEVIWVLLKCEARSAQITSSLLVVVCYWRLQYSAEREYLCNNDIAFASIWSVDIIEYSPKSWCVLTKSSVARRHLSSYIPLPYTEVCTQALLQFVNNAKSRAQKRCWRHFFFSLLRYFFFPYIFLKH